MISLVQQAKLWIPTWQGWLVLAIALGALVWIMLRRIHPFLAVTRPLQTDVAIVEGWLPDDVLKTLVADLQPYRLVITTGYPVVYGRYLRGYDNFAQVAADTLICFGLPAEKLVPVGRSRVERERTLSSAIAVRDWMHQNGLDCSAVNLYSLGCHARRSRLVFRRALAPVQVGIVAAKPQDHDPAHWWHSSSGTRQVLSEGIGYLYARIVHWAR